MTEKHEFQFAGCHLPRSVVQLLRDKKLGATDLLLYVMVAALEGDKGCFASNAYLANSVGVGERGVQKRLVRLRELGLVTTTRFDGRRRWLRTCKPVTPPVGVAEVAPQGTHKSLQISKSLPVQGTEEGVDTGFGMVPKRGPGMVCPTDMEWAEELFRAVRAHLGPDHILIRKRRPGAWATHFERLRRLDEVSETDIRAVLGWYCQNIGGEFVPEAYAGESFRKKFPAIQAAMKRRGEVVGEVSMEAVGLAERLEPMGWPAGSGQRLAGAIHTSLIEYTMWRAVAVGCLQGRGGFADHVVNMLPQPGAFVEQWFRDIHRRVSGWQKWDGQFRGMEWRPEHDKFRAWGWGLATDYTGNRQRWDGIMKTIKEAMRDEN